MRFHPLVPLVESLQIAARGRNHRHLLLLSGTRDWCHAAALAVTQPAERLWIGDSAIDTIHPLPASRARTRLGGEQATVIYDAHAGFDVDALAVVTGTLRGGGLLLLLAPPLDDWPSRPDPELARLLSSPFSPADAGSRFVTRLVDILRQDPAVTICLQDAPTPEPEPIPGDAVPGFRTGPDGCVNDDQRRAVEAVVQGADDRIPVVLVSDRGRGKSAALGLAAARLLTSGTRRIVVTAPRRAAVQALFHHAAVRLGLSREHGTLRTPSGGELCYIAPDALLRDRPAADLVLVDEAAAIPAPMLEGLLLRDRRIAFATTVHGYEGSGRGFALRFRATLDRLAPGWKEVRLQEPVRWAADDPLETLLFRLLLLDAEPSVEVRDDGEVRFERVDRDLLVADESRLRDLFGLLVQAHYRTTPSDLRQLLDAPGVSIHLALRDGSVAGVAVTVDEGKIDPETAFAVWAGRRRLRGHLVAQSLASHAGLPEAPELAYRRIQRIAVDPRLRRRGLGRHLLDHVTASARADGCDLVATSFGLAPELVGFWSACGFVPVRLGLRREASSGCHALMMLRPLSTPGKSLAGKARARLARGFMANRRGPLADLEPPLAQALARNLPMPPDDGSPDAVDWAEAAAFAFAHRGPDAAFDALRRVVDAARDDLAPGDRAALEARFVDCEAWPAVIDRLGVQGRRYAIERFRLALRPPVIARIGRDEVERLVNVANHDPASQ
jgi:tRNA(Met) cytidine acetyltransferase